MVHSDLQLLAKMSQFEFVNPVFMGFHETQCFMDHFTGGAVSTGHPILCIVPITFRHWFRRVPKADNGMIIGKGKFHSAEFRAKGALSSAEMITDAIVSP